MDSNQVEGNVVTMPLRVSGKYNPIRVVFDTTLRACGTLVRILMPLLFFVHSISSGLGLGLELGLGLG